MPGAQFRSNLTRGVDGWVDFSSEPLLRARQRFNDLLERCLPDHKEVDVAGGAELTPRRRTEDQGHEHTFAQWCERLTDHVAEPRRLCKQSLQFRKDRRLAIGLEIHLSALDGAAYEPGSCQLLEFPLHGADTAARVAHDLTEVVGLVGVTQKPAKYPSTRAAEKNRGRINQGCSHIGYNRTRIGNITSRLRLTMVRPGSAGEASFLSGWRIDDSTSGEDLSARV